VREVRGVGPSDLGDKAANDLSRRRGQSTRPGGSPPFQKASLQASVSRPPTWSGRAESGLPVGWAHTRCRSRRPCLRGRHVREQVGAAFASRRRPRLARPRLAVGRAGPFAIMSKADGRRLQGHPTTSWGAPRRRRTDADRGRPQPDGGGADGKVRHEDGAGPRVYGMCARRRHQNTGPPPRRHHPGYLTVRGPVQAGA
jgi:hypothetical protein